MADIRIPTPKMGNPSPLARQQAIENALSTALYFIRLAPDRFGFEGRHGPRCSGRVHAETSLR